MKKLAILAVAAGMFVTTAYTAPEFTNKDVEPYLNSSSSYKEAESPSITCGHPAGVSYNITFFSTADMHEFLGFKAENPDTVLPGYTCTID